jgi:hypothetical protein
MLECEFTTIAFIQHWDRAGLLRSYPDVPSTRMLPDLGCAVPDLFDSSLLKLIYFAVAVTGGIFLAVLLGGLLSALMTLGALELGYRAKIQKEALVEHFDVLANLNRGTMVEALRKRHGLGAEHIADYIGHLASSKLELAPVLAQMSGDSLYRLHYRQICGQFMAVVQNEAISREALSEEEGRNLFTPLTDVLQLLPIARRPEREGFERPTDRRSGLDLALREIDGIQARLGRSINNATFPFVLVAWSALYVPTLIISAYNLPLFTYTGGVFAIIWTLVQHVFVILIAALGGGVFALGSAVFGSVAFSWLDRIFASK